MKISFDTIFKVNNGTVTNREKIRVGGVTLYPGALDNYKGAIGGVDFSNFVGRDLDIKTDGDTYVIIGIY